MQANTADDAALHWPLTGTEALDTKRVKRLQRRTDWHGLLYFAGHALTQLGTGVLIWLAGSSIMVVRLSRRLPSF